MAVLMDGNNHEIECMDIDDALNSELNVFRDLMLCIRDRYRDEHHHCEHELTMVMETNKQSLRGKMMKGSCGYDQESSVYDGNYGDESGETKRRKKWFSSCGRGFVGAAKRIFTCSTRLPKHE